MKDFSLKILNISTLKALKNTLAPLIIFMKKKSLMILKSTS